MDALSANTTESKVMQYRWTSVRTMAEVADRIARISPDKRFAEESGLSSDIPTTSYHATSDLIVEALQTGLGTLMTMHSSPDIFSGPRLAVDVGEEPFHLWCKCVRSLLWCLTSLQTTVWGSNTALAASQRLMQQYGDLLCECWSPEATATPDVQDPGLYLLDQSCSDFSLWDPDLSKISCNEISLQEFGQDRLDGI